MKKINDTLGHEFGDKALIETSNIMHKSFRTTDILSRLGGDEFVVVAVKAQHEFIPIIIQSATSEDSYEGEFSARRTIIWTISFMMKGFIYPDIKTGQSIIKTIEVAFKEVSEASPTDDHNEILLETSTPFSEDQFLLETGSLLLTEDSTTELGQDNIISKITIIPEGGANT